MEECGSCTYELVMEVCYRITTAYVIINGGVIEVICNKIEGIIDHVRFRGCGYETGRGSLVRRRRPRVRQGQRVILDMVGKWQGRGRAREQRDCVGARGARDKGHGRGDVGNELAVRGG